MLQQVYEIYILTLINGKEVTHPKRTVLIYIRFRINARSKVNKTFGRKILGLKDWLDVALYLYLVEEVLLFEYF